MKNAAKNSLEDVNRFEKLTRIEGVVVVQNDEGHTVIRGLLLRGWKVRHIAKEVRVCGQYTAMQAKKARCNLNDEVAIFEPQVRIPSDGRCLGHVHDNCVESKVDSDKKHRSNARSSWQVDKKGQRWVTLWACDTPHVGFLNFNVTLSQLSFEL